MIGLIALLVIVSLSIYIIKSAEPIYRFIQKKISLYQEKKKIKKQTFLLETRGAELLALGYKAICDESLGPHFIKKGHQIIILEDQLRGWSDSVFNEVVYGYSKKE